MDFVDDQLLTMLRKIYAAFDQDFSEFQSDERVMPLDRYANVGKQLMVIEKIWQDTIRQEGRGGVSRRRVVDEVWAGVAPRALSGSANDHTINLT